MLMGLQCLHAPSCLQIPNFDRLVVRCAQQELARRVEHKSAHPVVVSNLQKELRIRSRKGSQNNGIFDAYQGVNALSCCVPKLDGLVSGSCCDVLAGKRLILRCDFWLKTENNE